MLAVSIIFFREILEVALVFSVLLAATRGVAGRSRVAWAGVTLGVLASVVVALFAEKISSAAEGMGQELFNASILFLATVLITWHVVWMSRHGRQMAKQFRAVGESVLKGEKPPYMIAVVMAIAVLREGSEIVLFTYGVVVQGTHSAEVLAGGLLGLAAGTAAGALFYAGLLKTSPKRIFGVTGALLILLAAGMIAQAVGFLSAAGRLPELVSPLWDTSRLVPESGLLGKILHSLFGYCERPSGSQVLAYGITIGVIVMLLRAFGEGGKKGKAAVAAVLIGLLCAADAHAFPKVYSPIIETGELEIEAQGSVTFDRREDVDNQQSQRYDIGYGFTDWWATEIEGILEKPAEEGLSMEAVEWANRFEPFPQGQNWIDVGFYFAYEFNVENKPATDEIEAKLLLEKQLGSFVHDVNLNLNKEVNPDSGVEADDLEASIAWSARYRFRKEFEPGFELYHDFGVLRDSTTFDEQKMQLGPVVYGKIGPVKYDIGYLFGVSEAAPDGELKWIMEYEYRF